MTQVRYEVTKVIVDCFVAKGINCSVKTASRFDVVTADLPGSCDPVKEVQYYISSDSSVACLSQLFSSVPVEQYQIFKEMCELLSINNGKYQFILGKAAGLFLAYKIADASKEMAVDVAMTFYNDIEKDVINKEYRLLSKAISSVS